MKNTTTFGTQRWAEFRSNFHTTYFDMIASDDLKCMMRLRPEELMEFAMVILYGNASKTLMRLFVQHVLMEIFNITTLETRSATMMCNATNVSYAYSNIHIEMDFDRMDANHAMHIVSDFFAKHIAVSKCYGLAKHIVVMHNLDRLPRQSSMALRKFVETSSNNVVCIATCTHTSKIGEALRSRGAFIRCNIERAKQDSVIATLMRVCGERPADTPVTAVTPDTVVTPDTPDSPNIAMHTPFVSRICAASPFTCIPVVERIVSAFLSNTLRSCKSALEALPAIRKFTSQALKAKMEVAPLMASAIRILQRVELVGVAARTEHEISMHGKPHLALECFFMHVFDIIVPLTKKTT